jgi:stage II sporulation protein D
VKPIKKDKKLQELFKKKQQKNAAYKKHKLIKLASKKTSSRPIGKGSTFIRHGELSYKLPIILGMLALFSLILVIPSLIVVLLGNSSEQAESVVEGELELDVPPEESVSVAVMRTQADVVEDIPLENYIVGVVAAEMHPDFEMEALKAQALAARTYAVSHLLGDKEEDYDVTDTIQHQVYRNKEELKKQWGSNFDENMKKIEAAVKATEGEIITYENHPIMPAYFSMSNGYTENSEDYWENEVPYLRSVPSPWELENPKLVDQETFTHQELEELLQITLDGASDEYFITRNESGRVNEFKLNDHTFTGREIRDALGLRSSDFSVKENNDHFIFTTKGYGHGIGMSQYGADAMAQEGKTYEEIVKYYYQDVEINSLDEAAPTLVAK